MGCAVPREGQEGLRRGGLVIDIESQRVRQSLVGIAVNEHHRLVPSSPVAWPTSIKFGPLHAAAKVVV
jgi:hypothetical protein